MGKPIEVGCWAVIYKPTRCCGAIGPNFGIPFLVSKIERSSWFDCCPKCGYTEGESSSIVIGVRPNRGPWIYMVKRIDPPGEEQTTDTKEALTA